MAQPRDITITPARPERGQTVEIKFHPTGKVSGTPTLVFSYSNFFEMPVNVPLTQDGDSWKMSFVVPRYAKYASFYVRTPDSIYKPQVGHNELVFYKDGKPVFDTYLYKAYSLQGQFGKDIPPSISARRLYEEELKLHPDNYAAKLRLFMAKMNDDKPNAAVYRREALQTVTNKLNENPTNMGNINQVTMGYLILNENARIDTLKAMLLAKYPASEVAFEFMYEDAYKTKNEDERAKKMEGLLKKYADKEARTLSGVHQHLFDYYAKKKDLKRTIAHAREVAYLENPWRPRELKNMAQTLADNNLALDSAEKYARIALKQVDDYPFGVVRYFPEYGYIPGYVDNKSALVKAETGNLESLLAYIHAKQGKVSLAAQEFESAKSKTNSMEMYKHLAFFHEQQKKYELAFADYRSMLLQLPTDSALRAGFKRNYMAKNGSEAGYTEVLSKMLADWELANLPAFKKTKLNKPAPELTALLDMNGKLVNPSELKGKVLVIDFWATWCVPCIEGFPYMQKVYERFKNNPEVVFLITNSGSKNTLGDAQEWVKKNHFTFPFYYNDRSLAEAFGINTIPSTFVIDQSGKIQYRTVGFEGPIMEPKLGLQIKSLLTEK